jgi:tetratricopeptide (TPR) repeat protein
MGDLYRTIGHVEQARDAYLKALEIGERLAQAEPHRADYQRDLAISLMQIGAFTAGAEELSRALAILSLLAARDRLDPVDRPMLENLERALRRG